MVNKDEYKIQLIRHRTLGEERLGATAIPTKISSLSWRKQLPICHPCFTACSVKQAIRIDGVKLIGLHRMSFDAIIHANHHVDWQ